MPSNNGGWCLLFALRPEGLLFATLVHHGTFATRAVWAAVERAHVRAVLTLLERACRSTPGDVTESAGAGLPGAGPG